MPFDVAMLPPGHPLHPFVYSVFDVRVPAAERHAEAILPKGNVDILFNLGGPIDVARDGVVTTLRPGEVQLAGLQTSRFDWRPQADTRLLGISLRMEAAAAVLRFPQHEITDLRVEAACAVQGVADLIDRLAGARDFHACRSLMLQWIAARVRTTSGDRLIQDACVRLGAGTDARVASLARDAGLSPRQFQRRFNDAVGLAPVRYAKLKRFIHALRLMSRLPALTDVAHAAGYADQPHFCHDFRELAGMTPDGYRSSTPLVPGHVRIAAPGMSDSYKP